MHNNGDITVASNVAVTTYLGGIGSVTGASFSYCSNTGNLCAYNTTSAGIYVAAMNCIVTKCTNCLISGTVQRKADAAPVTLSEETYLTYTFQKAATADKIVDCYFTGPFVPEPVEK